MRAVLLLLAIQACDREAPAARERGAETDRLPALGEPVGEPAVAGERVVWASRQGRGTALWAWEPGAAPRLLTDVGTPDRPALSADGQTVVFVSGASGLASLWTVPFQGGIPTQITNRGLESRPRAPGQPPEGWVPPPHRGPPSLEDGLVRWTAPDGLHEVSLP